MHDASSHPEGENPYEDVAKYLERQAAASLDTAEALEELIAVLEAGLPPDPEAMLPGLRKAAADARTAAVTSAGVADRFEAYGKEVTERDDEADEEGAE